LKRLLLLLLLSGTALAQYPAVDAFSGAGPVGLGANWTNIISGTRVSGTPTKNAGVLGFSGGSGSDPVAVSYYSSLTFSADQYAQFVVGPDSNFDSNTSPMVRVDTSTGNGYSWDWTTNKLQKWTAGANSDLTMTANCPGTALNDTVRVSVVGTTIYCTDITTGSFGSATDSTYSTGVPAVMVGSFSGHLAASGPWQADCYPYRCNSVEASPYSPLYPWANIIDYYSASPVTVTLSGQGSGWTLCYTLDGTTPTATTPGTCSHGTTYSSGFTVSATGLTTVKTLATKASATNSLENDYIYNIGHTTPIENGCQLFPSNSIFNTPINTAPVDSANNTAFQGTYASTHIFHDFYEAAAGGANGGIPYNSAISTTPTQTIPSGNWFVPAESDDGPYSILANTVIENIAATGCTNTSGLPQSTDYHMLTVANLGSGACQLQEMYQASCSSGTWSGYSGAIWDLTSNALRTDTWTSADAAGLPITPFLVKYDEAISGVINHPFRFTTQLTGDTHLWPARHNTLNGGVIPIGSRLRLQSGFNISGYSPMNQVILTALKTYGMFVADNGNNGYFQGVTDPRWTEVDLDLINSIAFSNFEVVNEQGLQAAGVNSQQAIQATTNTSQTYGGVLYGGSIH
jgi:Chitobiase/beta-hexosaminidase C-terminal domain